MKTPMLFVLDESCWEIRKVSHARYYIMLGLAGDTHYLVGETKYLCLVQSCSVCKLKYWELDNMSIMMIRLKRKGVKIKNKNTFVFQCSNARP